MQATYDGKHSLLIGDFVNSKYDESGFINTWNDWHLIPVSRPVINPPSVQENSIEIPGMNGKIDLTQRLTGFPLYYNRTGSIDFYVDTTVPGWEWDAAYDVILNSLHGFNKKVILTDTPSFYYEGRLSVNSWKSDKLASTITIDYDLAPFKQMIWTTMEDWLWNPFDFEHGMIIDNKDYFRTYVPTNPDPEVYPTGRTVSEERTISGLIIGAMPTSFSLRAATNEKIDWSKITDEPPGVIITVTGQNARTYRINFVESDDTTASTAMSSLLVHTSSDEYIGSPELNYEVKYQFINTFRNSSGNYLNAIFYWDFRPGRL